MVTRFTTTCREIENGFQTVLEGEPLDIYLSETNANSLYAFADTIAGRAMLEGICPVGSGEGMGHAYFRKQPCYRLDQHHHRADL